MEKKKNGEKEQKGKAVGRIAYAAPPEGERFYLRLLLANIRGPTSFTDVLTANGKLCSSFQEADTQHGFVKSNNIVETCMEKGIGVQMPSASRRLFATLLIFSEPPNAKDVWSKYYTHLSEDFQYTETITMKLGSYTKQPQQCKNA